MATTSASKPNIRIHSLLAQPALLILLFALTGYLLFIASRISVDYFDSFSLLLNARAIAEGKAAQTPFYDFHRFLLASLIHIPAVTFAESLDTPGIAVRISHLIGIAYFIAAVWAGYELYRLFFPKTLSLLATLVFATIPLLLHYSPSAKEDVPALFFFVMALRSYLPAQNSKWPWRTGIWTGFAAGHRYNLGLVLGTLFLVWECVEFRKQNIWNSIRRLSIIAFAALLVLTVSILLIYPRIGPYSGREALQTFVTEIQMQYSDNRFGYLPPYMNIVFLIRLFSLPLLGLALIGGVKAYAEKWGGTFFLLVVFVVTFLVQTFLIPGKEGRYLFALIPSTALFVALGITAIPILCREKQLLWVPALCILLAVPIQRTIRECLRFQDPFYTNPFAERMGLLAKELAKVRKGRIFWVGRYAASFPKEAIFDPQDPFAYIYHVYINAVYFYTGIQPGVLTQGSLIPRGDWSKGYTLPGSERFLKEGDVLIINPTTEDIWTKNLPDFLPPVIIQRVSKTGFDFVEPIWARPPFG